jgi:RNase adapter protein RapZ
LKNPHHHPELQPLTGLHGAVQDFVQMDPMSAGLRREAHKQVRDGAHIAFGCYGGRHRSVAMAELTAKTLREVGWDVEVEHTAMAVKSTAHA